MNKITINSIKDPTSMDVLLKRAEDVCESKVNKNISPSVGTWPYSVSYLECLASSLRVMLRGKLMNLFSHSLVNLVSVMGIIAFPIIKKQVMSSHTSPLSNIFSCNHTDYANVMERMALQSAFIHYWCREYFYQTSVRFTFQLYRSWAGSWIWRPYIAVTIRLNAPSFNSGSNWQLGATLLVPWMKFLFSVF